VTVSDLLGGAAVLDFVNTVDPRLGPQARDFLKTPDDLEKWAAYAGIAAGVRVRGAAELGRVLELREALYRIFGAIARDQPPGQADLDVVHATYMQTLAHARLARDGGTYRWRVKPSVSVDALLHPLLESALDLLDSNALRHVKVCDGEECGWLFLDTSRNRNRRWCSMSSCGARAKMRRYRARNRG
jgi:predicted RNA-binding Zn ribbon-like protein